MPNILGKNINFCLTMIGRPQLTQKNIPTPEDHTRPLTTTSSSSSTTYIKNYNSLYEFTTPNRTTSTSSTPTPPPPTASSSSSSNHNHNHSFSHSDDLFSSDSDHDPDIAAATPDFATLCASKRFFFSSPGLSNSIVDSSSSSSAHENEPDPQLSTGGVAVQTYSPDPYLDFRRSMQEMVEAHRLFDAKSDWERLHELLMCYLSLNPKGTHKFIVAAFADMLVSLMAEDGR